jgi:hypothetical protein
MVENATIAILTGKEAIAIYIAIVGIFVSGITYRFERKRFRATVLIEEMRTLNDIKHREARKVVYWEPTIESFEIFGLSREDTNVSQLKTICENIVRSDLNEMATLFRHNMVERPLIIEEYWWIILRSWNELEEEIKKRREGSGPHDYMKNLEELKNKAEKYATNKYPENLKKLQQGRTQSKASFG